MLVLIGVMIWALTQSKKPAEYGIEAPAAAKGAPPAKNKPAGAGK